MQHTLYLTAEEEAVFRALSEELRDGWQVERENLKFKDTDQQRQTRYSLTRFTDPRLTNMSSQLNATSTPETILETLGMMDISMQNDDFLSLLFALGPDVISSFISYMLSDNPTDETLVTISGLSSMRHMLDNSLSQ